MLLNLNNQYHSSSLKELEGGGVGRGERRLGRRLVLALFKNLYARIDKAFNSFGIFPLILFYLFIYLFSAICSTEMNVVFSVEGSYALGEANFQNIFSFIFNLSSNFDLATTKTWIITLAGNETRVYKTKEDLKYATAPHFPNSSQVSLGKLLESVKDWLYGNYSRMDVATIVVVITSQKSDDDIAIPTINLKNSNVTLFSVAIGSQVSLGQLSEIASNPKEHHLLQATNTRELSENFNLTLARRICEGKFFFFKEPFYPFVFLSLAFFVSPKILQM